MRVRFLSTIFFSGFIFRQKPQISHHIFNHKTPNARKRVVVLLYLARVWSLLKSRFTPLD